MGLADQQAGHQLGNRRNGNHRVVVFAEQHFLGILVYHQRHARLQSQRIVFTMQAR